MSRYDHPVFRSSVPRVQHEKSWVRSKATAWDQKWHELSASTRRVFLEDLKGPAKPGSAQASTSAGVIDPKVVDELVKAGFVRLEPGVGKKNGRIVPLEETHDFAVRVRAIHRYGLLGKPDLEVLAKFVKYVYHDAGQQTLARVLAEVDPRAYFDLNVALDVYVMSSQGPRLAAKAAKSVLASPLIEALIKAPGPVPLVKLPGLLKAAKPEQVREALDELLVNMGVFEGIDPKTFDIVVGLLPLARQRLEAAEKGQFRPPLVVVEKPAEIASPAGMAVNDLRVFLLEVASQPPRLRQDGDLFSKEEPRFLAALPEWPDWLYQLTQLDPHGRLKEAFDRTKLLGLTEADDDGDKLTMLQLSGKGRNWLSSGLDEQYDFVYEFCRKTKPPSTQRYYDEYQDQSDMRFLGLNLIASSAKNSGRNRYYGYFEITPEQRQALRESFYKAFASLPVGVFHTVESVVKHLTFPKNNPVLLGKDPAEITVMIDYRPVAKLPERLADAGKHALNLFIRNRLIPFEAMQVAVDQDGNVCAARLDRLDGYFGKPYKKVAAAASAETRVIVQPDFSVYVIGLNPAPAAELAPFCERTSGQAGQGSLTFKITRSSVIRAANQGLTASAIVARLKKHASIDVPENVVSEVREWANWIRLVNVKPVTVVRCPDRETVGRVVSALGKKAERLGDTLVALSVPRLTPAERQKLQDHGVIVTSKEITLTAEPSPKPAAAANETTPKVKRPRGRPRKNP